MEVGAAEVEPSEEPRIYVASLSDYNAGVLHGRWITPKMGAEAVGEAISEMLAASPTMARYGDVAEEWAIHDFEGFGPVRLGEFEDLEKVCRLAAGLVAHGDAFGAWWANQEPDGDSEEMSEAFVDAYQGEWPSMTAYGEQLLEDLGVDLSKLGDLPELLRAYLTFDIDGWVRDMELGGDVYTAESATGGVYVFWNH